MLTDQYGQAIQYPTLDDKPNARTLGENIVKGLTPKSVMTFDSASQRGATITAPTAGMTSWLKDAKQLAVYDGTAWKTLASGTGVWTTIPLTSKFATFADDDRNNRQGVLQYRVVNLFGDDAIMFRGGVYRSTYTTGFANNEVLNSTALPSAARPNTLRTVSIPCSDISSARITLKLDIQTDGILQVYGFQSDSKPPWIGFNGVFASL